MNYGRIAKFETKELWIQWCRMDFNKKRKLFYSLEKEEVESIMGLVFAEHYKPEYGWEKNLAFLRISLKERLINELKKQRSPIRDIAKIVHNEDLSIFPSHQQNPEQILQFKEMKREIAKKLQGKNLRVWNIILMMDEGKLQLTQMSMIQTKLVNSYQLMRAFGSTVRDWHASLKEVKKAIQEVIQS